MSNFLKYTKNIITFVLVFSFSFNFFSLNSLAAYLDEQSFTGSDSVNGDAFGNAIDMTGDGSRLVVAANTGEAAYVFVRSGTAWTEEAKLVSSDWASGDFFGYYDFSVSISDDGDRIIVGANGDDDNGSSSGSAYVFSRSGTTWSEEQKLTPSDGTSLDSFGNSVAMSGDGARVIISASGDDDNGSASGSAYVFSRSGTTWTEEQKLTASDGAAGDQFGSDGVSLSDDGSRAIVSAIYNDDGGGDAGSAYVFSRSGTTWTEEQELNAADPEVLHNFGRLIPDSMSGDGTRVAVTAYRGTLIRGAVYIFVRSGTTWTQEEKIVPSDAVDYDGWGYFGAALSENGDRVIFSSDGADIGANVDQGGIYVYTRSGTTWTEGQKVVASDGATEDYLGNGVTMSDSGSRIVAGMPYSSKGSGEGFVYVFFDSSLDPTPPLISSLSPADGATDVGITDNLVMVFDEAVDVETGNIIIYKSSDDSIVETIDVTSGSVTGTGTTTITIDPSVTLGDGTEFYVQIDATAFDDTADASYAGISDETTWNFTTANASSLSGSRPSRPSVVVSTDNSSNIPAASVCRQGDKFSITTGLPCPENNLGIISTPGTTNTSPSSSSACSVNQTLKLGSRGEHVKCLQEKLSIIADGIFGQQTKQAVVDFQTSKNLDPDGIVGPLTRAALSAI